MVDSINGFTHIVEVGKLRVEKFLCFSRRRYAAIQQQPSQYRVNAQLLCKLARRFFFLG